MCILTAIKNIFVTRSVAEQIQDKLDSGYKPKCKTTLNEKQLNTLFGKAVKEYNKTNVRKIFL